MPSATAERAIEPDVLVVVEPLEDRQPPRRCRVRTGDQRVQVRRGQPVGGGEYAAGQPEADHLRQHPLVGLVGGHGRRQVQRGEPAGDAQHGAHRVRRGEQPLDGRHALDDHRAGAALGARTAVAGHQVTEVGHPLVARVGDQFGRRHAPDHPRPLPPGSGEVIERAPGSPLGVSQEHGS